MNKCNFCNTEFTNKYNLKTHINGNKKCIQIQKVVFNKEKIDEVSKKLNKEINELKKKYDKLQKDYEKLINENQRIIELETIIKEKEKYILKLEEQNKIYIEHMKDLSSKPIKENEMETKNEEEYRISIDIQPYLTSDVIYFFEFHPKDEETEENVHYFEYGTTSNIKQRHTSYGKNYRLDKVFVYKNRYLASVGEKYLKQIITDLKLRYLYKNKLECMKSSYTNLDKVYEIMEKHCTYSKEEKLNSGNEMEKYNLISSLFKDNLITFEQFENCIVKLNLSF
jgi:hypothetical protein